MKDGIGLGVAIHTPLAGAGEPGVSFFGNATILGQPFTLRGGNATGAWKIDARLDGTIDLKHTIESLYGTGNGSLRLPSGFPQLTLSELSFSFDTATDDYEAQGRTAIANLPVAGTLVENVSLALQLGSTAGNVHATLQSNVVWKGVDAHLDVQIAPKSTAIRLAANKYEFFLGRAATDSGANILALVRPGAGAGFDDVEFAWAKTSWSTVPFRPNTP